MSSPHTATQCRFCDSPLNPAILDLGDMALANSFVDVPSTDEYTCPLAITVCPACFLVQLTHVVPAERMFSHYLYVSSTTQTFREHFAEYANSVAAIVGGNDTLAVDIGSNDGLLLSCYEENGMNAVGVEPATNLSDDANGRGLTTLNTYFNDACTDRILTKHGCADAISANNVFAHINDVQSVCRNVARLLKPDGIFIIEFPYLRPMFDEMLFDMIYHEHLSYIAISPLRRLLARFDLQILRIQPVSSHGGSLRVFIQRTTCPRPITDDATRFVAEETTAGLDDMTAYTDFAKRVYDVRDRLTAFVREQRDAGKRIVGYGAPAKGNTLINFCAFTVADVEYIVDDNPLKQNTYTPGANIPVRASTSLDEETPDFIILFAWNFASEIIKKLERFRDQGVEFIVPLPYPKVVE